MKDRALQIVVKSDSYGTEEAVLATVKSLKQEGPEVEVIHAGIGPVSQSDLFLAMTGSRLVVAFGVDVLPRMERLSKEKGVECFEPVRRRGEAPWKPRGGVVRKE